MIDFIVGCVVIYVWVRLGLKLELRLRIHR